MSPVPAAATKTPAEADDVLIVMASGPSGAPLRLRWLPSSSITIADLLSKLPVTVTHVRYEDPEGDLCTVCSDAELAAAIECAAVPNGRGIGGRPRRVLNVTYNLAHNANSANACASDLPKAQAAAAPKAASPKAAPAAAAPKAASPKAPAAVANAASPKSPAASATPKAPAAVAKAASPKAPAAAAAKAPAAVAHAASPKAPAAVAHAASPKAPAAVANAASPKAPAASATPKAAAAVANAASPKAPAAASSPKAPAAAASPKAPAAVANAASPKAPAASATPKAPAAVAHAASPKAPAAVAHAASPKSPAAATNSPKDLAKCQPVTKDTAKRAEQLAHLRNRFEDLKGKLASSKDDAKSSFIAGRLAIVTAKIAALSNAGPSTAGIALASATPVSSLAFTAPASSAENQTPLVNKSPAGNDLSIANIQSHLARNAVRGAAVGQKIVELESAAEAARQAGNRKRAEIMNAAIARARQQAAEIAERRASLLDKLAIVSPAAAALDSAVAKAEPSEPTVTASVVVALPAAPLCGLGPIALEQRLCWLSVQHASVLAKVSMMSTQIETLRANGRPHRADALGKGMAALLERAARLAQRGAHLAADRVKHAQRKPLKEEAAKTAGPTEVAKSAGSTEVTVAKSAGPTDVAKSACMAAEPPKAEVAKSAPAENNKPATVPLTALTAARPVAHCRGNAKFIAQHHLAKLRERRAFIDARIAQLEAEVASAR